MQYKIEAVVEIDKELPTTDDVALYVDAAMSNPEYPMRAAHTSISQYDQWVIDNEQQHDEEWEMGIDILRAMYNRGLNLQAMVDVILSVEKQKEEVK